MKTLPAKSTVLHEISYPQQSAHPARTNKRRNTQQPVRLALPVRLVLDLLFFGCIILLASCAWIQTHTLQLGAVGEVALSHIAQDAYKIGLAAFQNEVSSGFSTDLGYALQQTTREQLPTILSSDNLADYLKAWNTADTTALAALVPKGLDAPSAQKVALVIVDSQAAAIPALSPVEGPALLSSK
jgi:hypothetical protein